MSRKATKITMLCSPVVELRGCLLQSTIWGRGCVEGQTWLKIDSDWRSLYPHNNVRFRL